MPRRNHQKPHQPRPFMRTCADKRPYPSEKAALDGASLQMLAQPSLELSVYRCDLCGKWHLTRQRSRTS